MKKSSRARSITFLVPGLLLVAALVWMSQRPPSSNTTVVGAVSVREAATDGPGAVVAPTLAERLALRNDLGPLPKVDLATAVRTQPSEGFGEKFSQFSNTDWSNGVILEDVLLANQTVALKEGQRVQLDLGAAAPVEASVMSVHPFGDGAQTIGFRLIEGGESLHLLRFADGTFQGSIEKPGHSIVYKLAGDEAGMRIAAVPVDRDSCAWLAEDNGEVTAGFPYANIDPLPFTGVQAADVPILNSLLDAPGCVYLDFDGEVVEGTRWNSAFNGGQDIDAAEAGYSETQMRAVWEKVSEDFRPFQLNVTTDRSVFDSYAQNRRMMVIFSTSWEWFDVAGGVAYLNSFSDGGNDPCWVFTVFTGSEDGAGEAASHEVGHTFGLRHDGRNNPSEEYYQGNGFWGPIMGASYSTEVVQWSRGEYPQANNQEDDLETITAARHGLAYRADDYGDGTADAAPLTSVGSTTVAQTGIIEEVDDVDVFVFSTTGGIASLSMSPSSPARARNLNIRATILDSSGNVVADLNPTGNLTATFSSSLAAGAYYLFIEGAAEGTFAGGGFNDYGSLGSYAITGNVTGLGGAVIDIIEPVPEQVSIREGNGLFLEATVSGGGIDPDLNWVRASGPLGGGAVFSSSQENATRVTFTRPGLYELQCRVTKDGVVSFDTVSVSVEPAGFDKLFANRGPDVEITAALDFLEFSGPVSGRATDDDVPVAGLPPLRWSVGSGPATILNPLASTATLKFSEGGDAEVILSADDDEIRTFKSVMIRCVVERQLAAGFGSSAKSFAPRNANLDTTWFLPGFNDSGWTSGPLGFGYHTKGSYGPFIGEYDNSDAQNQYFKNQLRGKTSSLYVRSTFEVASLEYVRGLLMDVRYDDGFVAYLNGVEIARRNLPIGTPAYNTKASSDRVVTGSNTPLQAIPIMQMPTRIDLSGFMHLLQNGENVLAIQVCNWKTDDRELLIAPELYIDVASTEYYETITGLAAAGYDNLLPEEDADGDGFANYIEHAMGWSLTESDAGRMVLEPLGKGALRLTLPFPAPDDVIYDLERSVSGGASWETVALKVGSMPWEGRLLVAQESQSGGFITVIIREPEAPSSAMYRLRFRLRGAVIVQ